MVQCFELWNGVSCSPSDWPLATGHCGEELSCDTLGWSAEGIGSPSVCGSSVLRWESSGDNCVREASFSEGESLCLELGSRLCTVPEVQAGEGMPGLCDYDAWSTWSWAAPGDGFAECTNGSYGVAGSSSEWYSFAPRAAAVYEVRLLAETDASAENLISVEIYDREGERVQTETPPALHRGRLQSVMLRWNTTGAGAGPFFVRTISAAPPTVLHSIAVAATPSRWDRSQDAPHFVGEWTDLQMETGASQRVDLPFTFSYFGVKYARLFVSACAYVTFEEPTWTGPFVGTGGIWSAVLAAAGEFDVNSDEAAVSARSDDDHLTVSWVGHYAGSHALSNVSITLQIDGTVSIEWNTLRLSGSLSHMLASWLVPNGVLGMPGPVMELTVPDASDRGAFGTIVSFAHSSGVGANKSTIGAVNATRQAIVLLDAAIILEPMALGGVQGVSVSAWVHIEGPVRRMGRALFQSCRSSASCANTIGDLSIGREGQGKLVVAGAVFDDDVADGYWTPALLGWAHATVVIAERSVFAYIDGALYGIGTLESGVPRMLREYTSIGSLLDLGTPSGRPGQIALSDIRLYDRSLSGAEAAALFADPFGTCCVFSGLIDAFGVGSIDLTAQAMMATANTGAGPSAVTLSPRMTADNETQPDFGSQLQPCTAGAAVEMREWDVCGNVATIEACDGILSDGVGQYPRFADCGVKLQGYRGGHYTIQFLDFALTEEAHDYLAVYDGASASDPLLGRFSGIVVPPPLVSSGPDVFIEFVSHDTQAPGFRLSFGCGGEPVQAWRPGDVATSLTIGETVSGLLPSEFQGGVQCLGGVLLAVQCCAAVETDCANARVTELSLVGEQLRGSLPDAIGALAALRSLKLHDNFLTGTFPESLGRLHWLRELQLSHNQFEMQTRNELSKILGGMLCKSAPDHPVVFMILCYLAI